MFPLNRSMEIEAYGSFLSSCPHPVVNILADLAIGFLREKETEEAGLHSLKSLGD